MKNKQLLKGFTLTEVVISITILVAVTALALSGYMNLLKSSNQADIQGELDNDVQLTIEALKHDLRLSSMDEIVGWPEGKDEYTAISFPIAFDTDNDGMIERDPTTHRIIWSETIIYHIRPGTPDELVRTRFAVRDNSMTTRERQAQLNAVVAAGRGDASSVANNSVASSKTIFSNLVDWKILKHSGNYSLYSPVDDDLEEISLGYSLIKPGENYITMKCAGKENASTGFNIVIDQIAATPSYQFHEAENLAVKAGSTPEIQERFFCGNRHQLKYPASGPGDSLTLIFNNDQWIETDFTDSGYGYKSTEHTRIITDYNLSDIILKLEGNETTWEASLQTGSSPIDSSFLTNSLADTVVRTLLKGSQLRDGNFFECNGARCKLTFAASSTENLKISDVYFGESISSNSTELAFKGLGPTNVVTFQSGTILKSNSTLIQAGGFKETNWIDVPIDDEKNYLISYVIGGISQDGAKIWIDRLALNGAARTTRIASIIDPSATPPEKISSLQGWGGAVTNYINAPLVAYLPALQSVHASYVAEGTYTSDIHDTRLTSPTYTDFRGRTTLLGGSVTFKVRTLDKSELSTEFDWSSISEFYPSKSPAGNGRYIQFQATLRSDKDYVNSPIIHDTTAKWVGEERLVDVTAKFSKGTDRGNVEISVNGANLQSALIIDLEIYKKGMAVGKTERKISSSIKAEITPRNSGK